MFDKIVANALKSPSLTKELVDYRNKLASGLSKRGVLVLLSGLFLILQYIGMLQSPNLPNNANISSDTIYGGFSSKQEMLLQYDSKNSNFYKTAQILSISRNDLEKTKDGDDDWINKKASLLVAWNPSPIYKPVFEIGANQGPSFFAQSNKDDFRLYGQVVSSQRLDVASNEVLSGQSTNTGRFAVLKNSGNFLTTNFNANTCYKQPDYYNFYLNCPNGKSIKTEVKVMNITYKIDAEFIKNHPSDRLQYDLRITNQSQQNIDIQPMVYVGDILEYSELTNVENAIFDKKSQNLHWPKTVINGEATKTYTFSVKILDKIPLNPRGSSNSSSYDCRMSTFFAGSKDVDLLCPVPKIIERMVSAPVSSLLIILAWFGLVSNLLLYARMYVLIKEADIVLRDIRRKHV